MGKKAKDWLRFSVWCVCWQARGAATAGCAASRSHVRPSHLVARADRRRAALHVCATVDNALRRVDAAFEFIGKLGVEFYAFHDCDVAPQGATLKESNANLDKVAAYLEKKQKETGIKLLWGTANLFSHNRYHSGGATNPEAPIFAYAAAQVKKAMEVTHKLGGVNYVFWGGREGYQSILNTNVRRELDHFGA